MASLPSTIDDLKQRWALEVGQSFQAGGTTAWVTPPTMPPERTSS
jgi:hypothetical protein